MVLGANQENTGRNGAALVHGLLQERHRQSMLPKCSARCVMCCRRLLTIQLILLIKMAITVCDFAHGSNLGTKQVF
jgi:hypothetical protein